MATKICAYCGKEYFTRERNKYCSEECRATAKMIRMREQAREKRLRARSEIDRSAHQVDPNVWNHDYAKKQIQDTLSRYGRINLNEYKIYGNASTSRESD